MKIVYESSTAAEAHMVLHLLEQSDIQGRVDGEHLQGGVGELPAIGVVKVVVAPEQAARAKEIIAAWEKDQPVDKPVSKPSSSSGVLAFIVGAILGVGSMLLYFQTTVYKNGVDYDGNGTLDEKWVYKNNVIQKYTVDKNRDGKIDYVVDYDRKGIINKSKADDNFDGYFETHEFFERGNLVKATIDLDGDDQSDREEIYVNSVLAEIVIFGPKTRRPIKRQIYELGQLITSEYDSNGDGEYDTFLTYDRYEEVKTKSNKPINDDA